MHGFSQLRAMNREMALNVFDFELMPPIDVVEETLEEHVFSLRDFFLRQAIVPEVYRTRIQRLQRLHDAAVVLGLELTNAPAHGFKGFSLPNGRMETLLHVYAEALNSVRLQMTQSLHPLSVAQGAEDLVRIQIDFEDRFDLLNEDIPPQDTPVKAADVLDVGRLLLHLASGDVEASTAIISRERQRIKARRARSHHP